MQASKDFYLKYKIVSSYLAGTLNGPSLVGATDEVVSARTLHSQLAGDCNMETNMKYSKAVGFILLCF